MGKKRECNIQNKVQLICPLCGMMFKIPMCQAVNGDDIICQYCQKKIKFVL